MSDIANPIEQSKNAPRSMVRIVVWILVIGLLALFGWGLLQTNATRPEVGQQAPAFDLEFFDGYEWNGKTAASLDDMQGKGGSDELLGAPGVWNAASRQMIWKPPGKNMRIRVWCLWGLPTPTWSRTQ